MFARFVCALLSFRVCEFPAKSENLRTWGNYCGIHLVNIDRFYTLMNLLIELYFMSIFAMDVCMNNHTPKELKMPKRSL